MLVRQTFGSRFWCRRHGRSGAMVGMASAFLVGALPVLGPAIFGLAVFELAVFELPIAPAFAQSEETGVEEDATAASAPKTSGEVVTVSEAEAQACASKLEPMAATYENPKSSIYMQRLNDGSLQIWAPREAGPNAPFRPWCITTVKAVAGMRFLNTDNRAMITEILGASSEAPPPVRAGQEKPALPPTVIVEEEEEEDPHTRPLPAAFQTHPPKGARSAAEVGIPIPDLVLSAVSLPAKLDTAVTACQEDGLSQVTAVYDRLSGALRRSECRHPDGTETPLTGLMVALNKGAGQSSTSADESGSDGPGPKGADAAKSGPMAADQ